MIANRQKLISLTIAAFVVSVLTWPALARTKITINDGWYFFGGDRPDGAAPTDVSGWQRVNLPHSWNVEDTHDDEPGYRRGIGWYRRELSIPQSLNGKRIYLYFEGVGQTAELFVNGQRIGSHLGGYSAFTFDVTEALRFGEVNAISVKADNKRDLDIPPIDGDFNMYGGIYRDVWMVAVDDIHFSFGDSAAPGITITTPNVTATMVTVRVSGAIANKGATQRTVIIRTSIIGPHGRVAEGTQTLRAAAKSETIVPPSDFKVSDPKLWSPNSPGLYRVVARIEADGRILDEVSQPLGFRWFSFDADKGFFLNGKPLKLRGTNRHQDFAGLGNAVPDSYHVRDLEIIKENGFNFLRLAHYPQDPAVLEAADRLGLLIWEEIPVVNQIHLSQGFNANAKRMLREMIRQHRNHPSIILWGYMNEVFLPEPKTREHIQATVNLAKELEAICKSEDPSRSTVVAFDWGARDKYHSSGLGSVTDVVGWNLYHGWYYETFEDFGKFIDDQHRRYPTRPLIVSEFGANADRRVHSESPRRFDSSVEWQQMFHESLLNQIGTRPHIAGSAVWNQFDFGSEFRGETIPHLNQKGIYTFDRLPKDISYFYRASYSSAPVLHIAIRDRKKRGGASRQLVKVYTNLADVELFHNGRSIGKRTGPERVKTWDVDLVPGVNSFHAVGAKAALTIADTAETFYVDPRETSLIAINAGSNTDVIDAGGILWQAGDAGRHPSWDVMSGTTISLETRSNILGTVDDALFQSMVEGDIAYIFKVPDGEYEIDLRFVESKHKAIGARSFNVMINGADVFGPVDIFSEAGFMQQLSRKTRVSAAGGRGIEVRFEAIEGIPVLSGISVRKIS